MQKTLIHRSPDIPSAAGSGRSRRAARRGSLYVAVIGVGAVISILGMSALLVARVNLRSHTDLTDSTTARLNAQTALRLGMLEIEKNPDWRFEYTDSSWFVDRPLSGGTFRLEVTDPSDNDLTDASADPVVLTGIGRKGNAIHRTQITLAPLYRGLDCLQSAVHAGDDVDISNTYSMSSDHVLSANDRVTASNAYVGAAVEASHSISGGYYYGSYRMGVPTRDIPSATDALDFYKRNGTWIDVNSLPSGFADMVRNSEFENTADFWEAIESSIAADASTANSGSSSLLVSDRVTASSGVQQDVTHLLQSGRSCRIELAIYPTVAFQQFYVHLELNDVYGNDDHVVGPFTGNVNQWTTVSANITPWFDEPLSSAKLVVNCAAYGSFYSGSYGSYAPPGTVHADFRIDDVHLTENGNARTLDQVLLSPANNPFGETNDRGIYVVDLQGQKLVVKKSRIHGTLVLLNPSDSTELGDRAPLAMSPAVPSYPTLLVSGGEFFINPSNSGLVESAMQVNLNPTDAPYGGVGSDDDMDDTFASKIEGLIFSDEDIRLRDVRIHGTVISNNDVDIQEDFYLTYDNRYYRNPPPGFSGPERIRLLLGSAKRITE